MSSASVDTIRAALDVLVEPGQVVELRIPKVDGKKRTDAGYFTDLDICAGIAARYDGRGDGTYITLNQINPALLARAANRVKDYSDLTTADGDVMRRRWLPVDFDPVRPAGISSTDVEHDAALASSQACQTWLESLGWPAPVRGDSGNGGHLLYAIDLPNDEASKTLVQQCLQVIDAYFSTDTITVDTGVYNAGRVWKLYGTQASKGDSIPDRPHRRAALLDVPPTIECVSLQLLRELAAHLPPTDTSTKAERNGHNDQLYDTIRERFDLLEYARQNLDGDEQINGNGEHRIIGNKGLHINPKKQRWLQRGGHHGGDCFEMVGFVRYGDRWNKKDRVMWTAALEEAARVAGVELPKPDDPPVDTGGYALCPTHKQRLVASKNNNGYRCPAPRPGEASCYWWKGEGYIMPTDQGVNIAESEPSPVVIAPLRAPVLPDYAVLPDDLASQASPWLDAYINFSRRWSPQSYEGFHEAIGLWLLSAVAAQRVALDYGGVEYTNLYIALCSRTSMFAKTTAARIAKQVLEATALTHLLAPDDSSPQAFLRTLTLRTPEGYAHLSVERQDAVRTRLMFAAQKGWFYDEFGQKLHAMMQTAGTMVDFRGHLRRFDDCPQNYEYVTLSRGSDFIERPYLSLLASLTPADLRPHARKGSALWGDGFLARFALITPPADLRADLEDFPEGARIISPAIVIPLRSWHERLGLPRLTVEERTNEKGEGTGYFDVELDPPHPQRCVFGDGVRASVSTYRKALHEILQADGEGTDLDGNYARLHVKALRIAMLLASLENDGRIEMCHWARAQQIAERWRADLHNLVAQLGQDEPSRERTAEDRVMAFLVRQADWVTPRLTAQYVKELSSSEIKARLDRLAAVGRVSTRTTKQTTWYRATGVEGVDGVEVLKEAKSFNTLITPPPKNDKEQVITQGVEENKGVSTASTPQHLQHLVLTLTHEWQEVPDGWAVPPGADIRMDIDTGKNYARLLPRRKTGSEAIHDVLQAIRKGDPATAETIMNNYPSIDWSQERAQIAQYRGAA